MALAAAALALALRIALDPLVRDRVPFITFFVAVALVAWYCARGPALVVVVIGAITADYRYFEPQHSFLVASAQQAFGIAIYVAAAAGVAFLVDWLSRGHVRELQTADALARQGELLRVTLASIADGVITTDTAGRVTYLNSVAEGLTGWHIGSATDRPADEVFHIVDERTHQSVESPIARVMRQGRFVDFDDHTLLVAQDGTERPIELSGAVINRGGETVGAVLVFRDSTERRRSLAAERASARRLALALEAGRMGAWEWNFVRDEVWWSDNVAALHGINRQDFDGTFESFRRSVHPDDRERVETHLHRAIETAGEYSIEFRRVRPDGSTYWTGTKARVYRDESGAPDRLMGISMDITERRATEGQVLEARAAQQDDARVMRSLLRTIERLNSTLDLDTLFDILVEESTALVESPGASAGLCDADQAARRNVAAADPGRVVVPIVGAANAIIAFIELLPRRNGVPFGASDRYHLAAVAHTAGAAVQNALAYRRLWQAETALTEADRRKDEFLATLAHELRNPLAPIGSALEVMQRSPLDARAAAVAREMMRRQLRHLVRLVDDLLDVNRITSNRLELRRSTITLQQVIDSAIEFAGGGTGGGSANGPDQRAEGGVGDGDRTFLQSLPPTPVFLDADLTRLAQVVANLLTNARKFTDPGGTIWLTAVVEGTHVSICVGDNGIGLAPGDRDRIFELFTQLRTDDRQRSGLGIGLALARGLVVMHGGTLTVRSDGLGRGAEFLIELPIATAPVAAGAAVAADVLPFTPRRADRPLTILIADDNRDAAENLAAVLRLVGHRVTTASDGAEAVQRAQELRPDAALLDIGMPRVDGYEAARRLRGDPRTRRTMLIAVTGWGQAGDRNAAADAGFDHHLVKPVAVDELQAVLRMIASPSP